VRSCWRRDSAARHLAGSPCPKREPGGRRTGRLWSRPAQDPVRGDRPRPLPHHEHDGGGQAGRGRVRLRLRLRPERASSWPTSRKQHGDVPVAAKRRRDPERQVDPAGRRRADPRPARAAGSEGDGGGQGLPGRQAGHHHAGAAGPGPRGGEGHRPQVRDHVLRAPGSALGDQGRRAGPGRCDRQGRPDRQPGPAPDRLDRPSGLVLGQGPLRRHSHRHRLAPGRPVPVLHRQQDRQGRRQPDRQSQQRRPSEVRGLRRHDRRGRRRHGLCPGRLVHARRPGRLGRRAALHPRDRGLYRAAQVRRSDRPARRQPPADRRQEVRPVTSTAARSRCRSARSSSTTSSSAPRPPRTRRRPCWPPSWC
jgi:hypothetical protein